MSTHLIIPDQHAHPDFSNDRAEWLGALIADVKPDIVINIGDGADMPSLSSYDRGTKSFIGRTYTRDINAHIEFQERLWAPVYARKKRLPKRIYHIGNHEQRIARAINVQPELEGLIGYKDLELNRWYDEVIDYEGSTPGINEVDGVQYAHYFVSGLMGRSISGEHPATYLLNKRFVSSTCGHSHLMDFSVRTRGDGQKIMGCVVGVYQDYFAGFAGASNDMWWKGVVIKREVENGVYNPEFVSMDTLKRVYS